MRDPKTCLICCKPHYGKGYCSAHYMRLKRHGDPLGGGTSLGEPMRFIHEVALRHIGDECLIWPFSKNHHGYGNICVNGKTQIVSRYICELVNGPPTAPDHESAHSCGNGHEGCISPIHLSWKTTAENEADKLAHGTHNRGERCGAAKLTEAEVREILALQGVEPQRSMAARFGVSPQTISNIHNGHKWAWLSEEPKEIAA